MKRSFELWLGISFAAHVAVAGVVTFELGRRAADKEAAPAPGILTGETLEVPGLEAPSAADEAPAVEDLDDAPPSAAPAPGDGDQRVRPTPPRRKKTIVRGGVGTPGETSGDAEPARFGAVGERGAVDLATAFTRGFPQAASADPIWQRAPIGSAGSIDVVLHLDATGHLSEAHLEPGGTPALRQGLSRTIALIRGRTFTSRKEVTRLRVAGTVSTDTVRNGAFGDVFAIGGTYMGRSGSAFFSLSVGKKIDVTVTER